MKENRLGIASLVLGIIGLLFSCIVIGIIPCIIGLVFSIIALTQKGTKHGTAIIGLACSIIGIGIFFLFILFIGVLSFPDNESLNSTSETIEIESPENNTSFTYEDLTVQYLRHEIITNIIDEEVLVIYYDFTNNTDENKTFDYSFSDKIFQNGVELEHSYVHANDESKNGGKEIKPGITLTVSSSFVLEENRDDVILEVKPLFSFTDDVLMSIDLELE